MSTHNAHIWEFKLQSMGGLIYNYIWHHCHFKKKGVLIQQSLVKYKGNERKINPYVPQIIVMELHKPIKAKKICSIFGCNQNLGYIMPMAFMISCEGNLHSKYLISPQATLLHYLLASSIAKNQSIHRNPIQNPN